MLPDSLIVHIVNCQPQPTNEIAWSALVISLITLIWQVLTWRRDRVTRLEIIQLGNETNNRIVDTTYLMIRMAILNVGRQVTTVKGISVKTMNSCSEFNLLPDPRSYDKDYYVISPESGGRSFYRNEVINHRVYSEGLLQPGECISGYVLAHVTSLPSGCFSRGDGVYVTVFDHHNRKFAKWMKCNSL